MNHTQVSALGKQFVSDLIALTTKGDISPLLAPDNIVITENSIALKNSGVKPAGNMRPAIYPGFSAPEVYMGRVGPASAVYFVGALLYALLTGTPPPDAMTRQQAPTPLSEDGSPLCRVLVSALEMNEGTRIGNLPLLLDALGRAEASAAAPAVQAPYAPPPAYAQHPPYNAPTQAWQAPPVAAAPGAVQQPAAPPTQWQGTAPNAPPAAPVAPGTAPPPAYAPPPQQQPGALGGQRPPAAPAQPQAGQHTPAPVQPVSPFAQPAAPAPQNAQPAAAPPTTPAGTPAGGAVKPTPYQVHNPANTASAPPAQNAYTAPTSLVPEPPPQPTSPRPAGAARPPAAALEAPHPHTFSVGNPQGAEEAAPPPAGATPLPDATAPRKADAATPAFAQPQPGGPPATPPPAAKPKKSRKKLIIVVVAAIVLLLAAGGIFFGYTASQNSKVDAAFAAQDYSTVVSVVDATSWIQEEHARQYDYAKATLLLEEGKIEESLALFESLGNFEDSARQVKAIRYQKANTLLEEGKYEEAADLYATLGNYEDSADKAFAIGQYLDAEQLDDPMERYEAYKNMDGFLDSAQKAEALQVELYTEGQRLYGEADYPEAARHFTALAGYEQADLFNEACGLAMGIPTAEKYERLVELGEAIDVGRVITDNYLKFYLKGNWNSNDGGGSLTMGENTFIFTIIQLPGGVTCSFRDSAMRMGQDGEVLAEFTYVSQNEFILTRPDGSSYTFHRS